MTWQEDAEEVRKALSQRDLGAFGDQDALVALARLTAALEKVIADERRQGERVAELEQQLLRAREAPGGSQDKRVAELETALDVLSRWPPGDGILDMCQFARAALGEE